MATACAAGAATAITGSSGILFVPTAEVVSDGHFAFGGMITDYQAFPAKDFSHFRDDKPVFYFGGYLTLGYIPRVEITIRGNGMPFTEGPGGPTGPFYTDGMISMQLLVHRGAGPVPSVGVGIQDMYGFMLFNALYGVLTWKGTLSQAGESLISVGWAVDWYDRNQGTSDARYYRPNHIMKGFVIGVVHPIRPRLSALAEYDSRSLNLGLRFRPVRWCTFDVAALRWGLDKLARGKLRGFGAHLHFDGAL